MVDNRNSWRLFPQHFIDDLRLQANIVQVVQEYVPLKRAGNDVQGPVSVPLGEDAVVPRQSREGVLPLLRLRRRRRRLQVPRAAREGRRFQDAVRMLAQKFGVVAARDERERRRTDARQDARLREALLKVHEVAAGVLPRAARRARRARARGSSCRTAASAPQTIEQLGLGLRAAGPRRAEGGAARPGLPAGAAAPERTGRPARQRRGRRPVPQPADGADLPRHRVGRRVRRPGDGRRPGSRST